MVDMRSGCADDLEKRGNKPKVVVDEVKSWRCLDPARVKFWKQIKW